MKYSKNKPLVSVIIPTRNSSRTIKTCLQTITDQSYPHIELIVVDNNSKDGTVTIAKRYTNKVYLCGPERSAQRNYGARKAKGEYLLIHDSDIYFHEDTIAECVSLLEEEKADAVIIPEKSVGTGYWSKVKAFERDFYRGNDYIEAPRFFKAEVYHQLGGYDELLTGPEDWDLMIKLRQSGKKIVRAKNLVLHDEGDVRFIGSSAKKAYYSSGAKKYQQRYPDWYAKQSNPLVRFPLKKIVPAFVKHPVLTLSLFLMKGIEYFYGTR